LKVFNNKNCNCLSFKIKCICNIEEKNISRWLPVTVGTQEILTFRAPGGSQFRFVVMITDVATLYCCCCHVNVSETKTKRNEIHRNETKFTETKRNKSKRNGPKRNEAKRYNTKWNKTYLTGRSIWSVTVQNDNTCVSCD
jgi:hypothetical protein